MTTQLFKLSVACAVIAGFASAQAADKSYDQMTKSELVALLKQRDAQVKAAPCKMKTTCPSGGKEMKSVTEPEKLSPFGAVVFTGVDMFTGSYDYDYPGSFGAKIGANLGYLILPDQGLGVQAGASAGIYDWNGATGGNRDSSSQGQYFVTTGLFYRGPVNSIFNAGVVYDAMFNDKFGTDQENPFLNQIRWQAGAKVYGKHELGFWGAQALNTAHTSNTEGNSQYSYSYRAISQASVYYRYPFENGAETFLWVGVPYEGSVSHNDNRAGSFVAGLRASVPITGNFSLYAEAAYMKSQRASGFYAAESNVESLTIGFSYGFGGQPNTEGRNMPLIPVANNGTFMTDFGYHSNY
jgi:hypothetical protein